MCSYRNGLFVPCIIIVHLTVRLSSLSFLFSPTVGIILFFEYLAKGKIKPSELGAFFEEEIFENCFNVFDGYFFIQVVYFSCPNLGFSSFSCLNLGFFLLFQVSTLSKSSNIPLIFKTRHCCSLSYFPLYHFCYFYMIFVFQSWQKFISLQTSFYFYSSSFLFSVVVYFLW